MLQETNIAPSGNSGALASDQKVEYAHRKSAKVALASFAPTRPNRSSQMGSRCSHFISRLCLRILKKSNQVTTSVHALKANHNIPEHGETAVLAHECLPCRLLPFSLR